MNKQRNNSDTKWMGAGLLAAFTASLCCITPVAAVFAGIGGFASAFSWIEPIRPYLIGATVLLLGFAWYNTVKPKESAECNCEEQPGPFRTKVFLGIVTVFAAIMLAFPYYAGALFPDQENGIASTEGQPSVITFEIEGMTCSGCAATIEHVTSSRDGVLQSTASYQMGTATVTFDPSRITKDEIESTINKTGFRVVGSKQENENQQGFKTFLDSETYCPVHGQGNCSGSCSVRGSCTVSHLNQTLANQLDEDVNVEITELNGSLKPVKEHFNSAHGLPRFIAVLSSVCRWCLDGAQKIQETILKDDKNIRLYIIWTDMLRDDNFETAQKAAGLLNDPRVTHFYEPSDIAGKKIAAQLSDEEGVAWDIYMFYNSSSEWTNEFPVPSDYVHQLNPTYYSWVDKEKFYSGEQLTQKLSELNERILNNKEETL